MANEMSLRKINVSTVPLLKTSYLSWSGIPNVQTFNLVSKNVLECVRDRMQRATRICRYFLCSSLFRVGGKIKSLLVAYGVPCGFLDLDCDSHPIEQIANTLEVEDCHLETSEERL